MFGLLARSPHATSFIKVASTRIGRTCYRPAVILFPSQEIMQKQRRRLLLLVRSTGDGNRTVVGVGYHPTRCSVWSSLQSRNFSAKNRKRKEAKRKKKQEERKETATANATANDTVAPQTNVNNDNNNDETVTVTVTQTKTTTEKNNMETLIAPTRPRDKTDSQEEGEEEEEFTSRFDMPNREKEAQLTQMQAQVSALYKQGNYKQALEIAQETLLAMLDHFGTTHPATASAYVNVGLSYKHLGEFDLALDHYTKALRSYQETVGLDHASYALTLSNIGMLYQSQIHLDETSKGLQQPQDRLRYNELALEHFQKAERIFRAELPPQHPHVVATQSALGMTLTNFILHQHKRVSTSTNTNTNTNSTTNANADANTAMKNAASNAASYMPTQAVPQHVTEESWKAAQEHLESAYQTALQHPRGESALKRTDKNHYLNLQKKYNLQQKQKQKQQQQQQQDTPTIQIPMQTASAALAAQNLAIFYKVRATTLEKNHPNYTLFLQKAQDLYSQVLMVRQALLPKGHPDIYITQYSLAELYEYTEQTESAQELRQTILDTYDPPKQKA